LYFLRGFVGFRTTATGWGGGRAAIIAGGGGAPIGIIPDDAKPIGSESDKNMCN
jgi:hypothetical protein